MRIHLKLSFDQWNMPHILTHEGLVCPPFVICVDTLVILSKEGIQKKRGNGGILARNGCEGGVL